jgi:AbrB family looped-hinge helix DNA binding protein
MRSMRVTKRGVVTIPLELRRRYDIKPGDEVDFVETAKGLVIVRRTARMNPNVDQTE